MKKDPAYAVFFLLAFAFIPQQRHESGIGLNCPAANPMYNTPHNGVWVSKYENGNTLDSGRLHKGIPDGVWQVWRPDGSPWFYRTYSADKWKRFRSEIVRYNAKRPAYPLTRLYHKERDKAEAMLVHAVSFCNAGVCFYKQQKGDKKSDPNPEGGNYHPSFEKGMLDGLFINYFNDGSVKDSGIYKTGLREDIWVHWSDDKKTFWKGTYHHGVKSREWKLFSSDARLLQIVYFKNGKAAWAKEITQTP